MNEKCLTIRISGETHQALKRMGEKENISLNALVNIALNEFGKRYSCAEQAKEVTENWYKRSLNMKKNAKND